MKWSQSCVTVCLFVSATVQQRIVREPDASALGKGPLWLDSCQCHDNDSVNMVMMMQHSPLQLSTFEKTLLAVSDPRSPDYGQHMTQADVTDLMAPPNEHLNAVLEWINAMGPINASVGVHTDIISVDVPAWKTMRGLPGRVTVCMASACPQALCGEHPCRDSVGFHAPTQTYTQPPNRCCPTFAALDAFARQDANPPPVQLAPFPTLGVKADTFWSAIGGVFTLFMVFSLMLPVTNAINSLVLEKERKIREGMFIMSLRKSAFYHLVVLVMASWRVRARFGTWISRRRPSLVRRTDRSFSLLFCCLSWSAALQIPPAMMFPEDAFARVRSRLVSDAAERGVPTVASVSSTAAILRNGTQVSVGGSVTLASGATWTLTAVAPPQSAVFETVSFSPRMSGAEVWAVCPLGEAAADVFVKPVGGPLYTTPFPRGGASATRQAAALLYPFQGIPANYWRDVLASPTADVLADALVAAIDRSNGTSAMGYGSVAAMLPRLTGQVGEAAQDRRHTGGPSFVSAPSSQRWWQVRQTGTVELGAAGWPVPTLARVHGGFDPSPGFARPDVACEWPNHDGPAPLRGPECEHVAARLDGWLPVINQGFRNSNTGELAEQLVFASGDLLFLANRSGSCPPSPSSASPCHWRLWRFFATTAGEPAVLQATPTVVFITAMISVAKDARQFLAGTVLEEGVISTPEPVLVDAARAGLVLARSAYTNLHPHYGVGPSYYASKNDAFPPTTLATAQAMADVGMVDGAAARLGYYLHSFVSNITGRIQYYGPAISEYGQLLATAAHVALLLDSPVAGARSAPPGRAWLTGVIGPLGAIVTRLVALQANATSGANRPRSGGMLWGCPEADLCNLAIGRGYFFSSSLWAGRGLAALADAAGILGLGAAGGGVLGNNTIAGVQAVANQLLRDTSAAARTVYNQTTGWLPPCVGCPGAGVPFANMTASPLASYTNYRFWPEAMSSGMLPSGMAAGIARYRRSHGGEILGMTRFLRWMDDWPLPGVVLSRLDSDAQQQGSRYAMTLLAHVSHHSSRGTYTAYEQSNYADNRADNCVPSQLIAPLLLTHMFVHAATLSMQIRSSTLMLHLGCPRHWLLDGFAIQNVPVRMGATRASVGTLLSSRANSSSGTVVSTCVLRVATALAPRGQPAESGCTCAVRMWCGAAANSGADKSVTVNGRVWDASNIDESAGDGTCIIRNVPCMPPGIARADEKRQDSSVSLQVVNTTIEVTAKPTPKPTPKPPRPPSPPIPPVPTKPMLCACSSRSACLPISTPPRARNFFACLDDGGPPGDKDNWAEALDWSIVTHVIRNTQHPLLIGAQGHVVINDPAWPTSGGDAVLCVAHALGVRVLADVDPIAQDCPGGNALQTADMLRNSTAIRVAAREIAAWVSAAGYDGVSFDWEGLNNGAWTVEFEREVGAGLVSLVRQTRAALRLHNPNAQVAFAVGTNNNAWANASYPLGLLAAPGAADWLFVMGYDSRHRNTDAGPSSPLTFLTRTIATIVSPTKQDRVMPITAAVAAPNWGVDPSKVVLGLGWYGYTYRCMDPVPSPLPSNPIYAPGMPTRPNCSAGVAPTGAFPVPCCSPWPPVSYSAAREFEALLADTNGSASSRNLTCSGKVWDERSASVVFECRDPGEHGARFQSWFDDANATAIKAALARRFGLGGFGIWTAGNVPTGAIGTSYWEAIAQNYLMKIEETGANDGTDV